MENEEKSDREGYLDFKLRVEQGDLALRLRAGQDWHNDPDNPQAPLAQYFDLFSAERHLDSMYHDRDRLDRLAREAEPARQNPQRYAPAKDSRACRQPHRILVGCAIPR